MPLQPYLFFNGRCDEAIAFYRQALGATTARLVRFKENPEPNPPGMLPDGWGEKVMHAELKFDDATMLVSDGHAPMPTNFGCFSLTLIVPDAEAAGKKFAGLAAGGDVRVPLGKTFFSPCFGMLTDKFGVGWMVYVGH